MTLIVIMTVAAREISELLCLPLTAAEQEAVQEHLTDNADADKFVIHLLQTGDVSAAVRLNDKLNKLPLVT